LRNPDTTGAGTVRSLRLRIWTALRGFGAAVVVLTRVPIGGFPYSADEMRWAAAWFPAVGAGIGGVLALVCRATRPAGPLTAAVVTVALGILLTGAMHEDGLADTADALGGGASRERVFAILKDSRVGSYGALSLVLTVLLRVSLLDHLSVMAPTALIASHCLARLIPSWLVAVLPYVTPDAVAKHRGVGSASWSQVIVASVCGLALLGALAVGGYVRISVAAAMLIALVVVGVTAGRIFQMRLGGVTGDFLGAAEQFAESVTLFVVAVAAGPR
jgi:adenosylcobinamide-GDP ribazoletransferase